MSKRNEMELDYSSKEYDYDSIKLILFNYWYNIALNQFHYKNLEKYCKGLKDYILEKQLLEYGSSVFFESDKGYMCLKPVSNGGINVYGVQTLVTPYGFGTSFNTVELGVDSVLIKNNPLKTSPLDLLSYYCGQLADIELTKQCNRNAIKTPYYFNTDDKTLLSAKNLFKKINSNEPVIFKNKMKGSEGLGAEVLNTGAQFYGTELEDQYNSTVAKILTLLGIDNYVEDKKERVQSAEVYSN